MSDKEEHIDAYKKAWRKKKKEDGAFDGRFVEKVEDGREQKNYPCRGEAEREAIEEGLERYQEEFCKKEDEDTEDIEGEIVIMGETYQIKNIHIITDEHERKKFKEFEEDVDFQPLKHQLKEHSE